jgi:hypothetical protein
MDISKYFHNNDKLLLAALNVSKGNPAHWNHFQVGDLREATGIYGEELENSLCYLVEKGWIKQTSGGTSYNEMTSLRVTAPGIDAAKQRIDSELINLRELGVTLNVYKVGGNLSINLHQDRSITADTVTDSNIVSGDSNSL